MAIKIKFDLVGNPEPPTIILANRNGNKLGQLKVNDESIELVDKFNDASELSFTINKYINDKLTPLWEKVVDFKLVYCKEWDTWFEIKVELDEETETVKTVFCTQLGQAELSQIMLYNIEINTEKDIERDDYKISILYDHDNPEASILNRILKDKAPHYSITYVSPTIAKIQRSFSFDGTSILDAFQEISEEIGCLFQYDAGIDENGRLQRKIAVYDLQQYCNDCEHRGEYTDECPKCGSTDIIKGYGDDTLIFATSDELASEGIQLVTDTDSVKNCFKLEAGDDLMTATIRNCNPNGTDYIWYLSDAVKEDMSEDLVDKLNSYDSLYKDYFDNHESKLDTDLVNKYNELVEKYEGFYNTKSTCLSCDYEGFFEDICPNCGSKNILSGKILHHIPTTIKGHSALMNAHYNTIDLALYLESALMPSIEMSKTTAEEQAALLTASSLSPVAVNTQNLEAVSLATANSAVLSMAKIIVKSTYKVEVKTSTLSDDKVWEGNFIITNYSDENDTAESKAVKVIVNNDTETFVKQKIEKALNKEDTDDYSISGLFEKNYDDFCAELKKYALNPLKNFYDSCDVCLNILIDQDAGNEDEKPDLYEKLYEPYYEKSSAISAEMKIREEEIAIIKGIWDKTDEENPELIVKGLQQYIEECKNEIQDALDFEKYLGEELWLEFCTYRREDTYSNDNYISDGLNNAELFKKAQEFFEVAENEIYKSAELQHSISTTLNNLLAIKKFKPLVDSFENGNWIRIQVDDQIYKLRLIEYDINFGSFDKIPVEFSDATKVKSGVTDVESILSQASSMATSYDSVKRQSTKGNNANGTINQWLTSGLNSALVRIQNNDSEDITLTRNGMLCRSYDDVTDTYSPEQFRLTHNIMAYTTDNWRTVSAALGKHDYVYYDYNKILQQDIGYGLSAKFVTAGYINGSQIIGGEIYSQNYTSTTGTYMDLNNGTFSWAGGKIKYDGNDVTLSGVNLTWSDIGDAPTKISAFENDADYKNGTQVTQITTDTIKTTNVVAENLQVRAAHIKDKLTASQINTTGLIAENISGTTITGKTISGGSLNINNRFIVDTSGNLTANANAKITGEITASSGSITGNLTVSGSLTHTSGNYSVTLRGVQSNKSNGVFYITDKSSGSNVYPFIVNGDGSFRATKATISGDSTFGGTLNAADGTFKGTLSAVDGSFTELKAGISSFTETIVKINANGQGYVVIGDPDYTDASNGQWVDITIRPAGNRIGNIGTPNHLWDTVYAKTGSISSSDRNMKQDIVYMGDIQEKFFNLLKPVTFKFIENRSGRTHYGFISQDIEESLTNLGLTGVDFAGFCKDSYIDENNEVVTSYSLRYTEFIALNTYMIQKLQEENRKLEERVGSLENKLKSLL